jgi:probable lipoprotein NlpC
VAPARPAVLALGALALSFAGCAAGAASRGDPPDLSRFDLQARLAARASSLVGHRGEFQVGAERFPPDCTGFVEAVYEAEGIPLRALMRRSAPDVRTGVDAAWRTMSEYGTVLRPGEWPAPGDLVFWHDTYDRNRNGRADDGLTHVGIVLYQVDRTVVFIHRGGKAVARGAMDPRRPDEAGSREAVVNSPIRKRDPGLDGVPLLAGALFAGYGRIDPGRLTAR